jgi:hypothetical protein
MGISVATLLTKFSVFLIPRALKSREKKGRGEKRVAQRKWEFPVW